MNEEKIYWVCPYCGKYAEDIYDLDDASCVVNAIKMKNCEFNHENRVVGGEVVKEEK